MTADTTTATDATTDQPTEFTELTDIPESLIRPGTYTHTVVYDDTVYVGYVEDVDTPDNIFEPGDSEWWRRLCIDQVAIITTPGPTGGWITHHIGRIPDEGIFTLKRRRLGHEDTGWFDAVDRPNGDRYIADSKVRLFEGADKETVEQVQSMLVPVIPDSIYDAIE